MNTKKNKNKNRANKPVNPVPVPKTEPVETAEAVSDVVLEERVPEIISDKQIPEDVTVCEPSDNSPQKPKRNRGKKKKEKDDFTDNLKPLNPNTDMSDLIIVTAEPVTLDSSENKDIAVVSMEPTTRKKKGKDKSKAHQEDAKVSPNENLQKSEQEKQHNVLDEDCQQNPKLDSELKTSKKSKKKSKKRCDSERSDKAEDLCTAAFQKMLVSVNIKDTSDSSVSEPTVREVDNKAIDKISILAENKEAEEVLSLPKNEPVQNKKKHKKDKKHQPLQDMGKTETTILDIELNKDEIMKDTKLTEEVNVEVQKVLEFQPTQSEEDLFLFTGINPKQKAKIAKPVERKNKTTGKNKESGQEKEQDKTEDENIEEQEDSAPTEKVLILDTDEGELQKKHIKTDNVSKNKSNRKDTKSPKQQEILDVFTTDVNKNLSQDKDTTVDVRQDLMIPGENKPASDPVPEKHETVSDSVSVKVESNKGLSEVESKRKSSKKGKKSPYQSHESLFEVTETKCVDSVINVKPNTNEEELKSEKREILILKPDDSACPLEIKDDIMRTLKEQTSENLNERNMFDQYPEKSITHKEPLPIIEEIPLVKSLEIIEIMDPKAETGMVQEKKDEESKNLDVEFSDFELVKKRKKSPKPPKSRNKIQDELVKALVADTESFNAHIETQKTDEIIDNPPSKEPSRASEEATEIQTDENVNVTINQSTSIILDTTDKSNKLTNEEIGIIEKQEPLKEAIGKSIVEPSIPTVIALPYESLGVKVRPDTTPKEKTDLKSKVMEVNKDMEGLRLSIEKSLAEFAALEQKDTEIEENVKAFDSLFDDIPKPKITPDNQKIVLTPMNVNLPDQNITKDEGKETISSESFEPIAPARKDNKKGKSKKNKSQAITETTSQTQSSTTMAQAGNTTQPSKEETSDKKDSKQSTKEEKGKQQSESTVSETKEKSQHDCDVEPIDNFEDALTSSVDDVNRSFEMIVQDVLEEENKGAMTNPNIGESVPDGTNTADETKTDEKKKTSISQPKNLLGHPNIPARSNKTDYKKEKDKTPNNKQAKVRIKDSSDVDKAKLSKQCQTENKPKTQKSKVVTESTGVTSENEEYIYKYSFRKVFLPSNCHVCKKELKDVRVDCNFCHLIFYCGQKHRDEDFPSHQGFCFAVSTITHLKGQKHIYSNIQNLSGQNYRLLRMQTILSCEKMLKRKLVPCEQELLLYPRICAEESCRESRGDELEDCSSCGQISFCKANPHHCPKSHVRWCKSYSLYQKLVVHQLTQGRLEPQLPTRVLKMERICDNINRVLADMYAERIDMDDMQYAALTQLATAPMTVAYSYQLYHDKMRMYREVVRKPTLTVHVVGAELQFEADSLSRWERFLLHLSPVQQLRVVLVGPELNPSELPLDLLGKVKLCADCRVDKRRVVFNFEDKKLYHDYCEADDFLRPDIVCAFNPAISRVAAYDDSWSHTLTKIDKLKVPFVLTGYTMNELKRDLNYIKKNVEFNTVAEPMFNPFSSVRPDRNFISDDEMPLLFKNYCLCVLIGSL